MGARRFCIVCIAGGLLMGLPRPAACQSYRFTKVLDGATQRPDGLGVFYITYSRTTPAFDGRWVVFRDPGPQNDDGSHAAIWSFNTQDRTFHKLVDFNTTVPGGATLFHDFQLQDSAPIVRNGVVVFLARDTAARQGLYSVPAGGGAITRIADRDTADPTGGVFTVFDVAGKQMGGLAFDGTTAVFNATNGAQVPGSYSAKPDGSSLVLVADSLHPAQNGRINGFYAPAISGGNVVMIGTDGTANNAGYNGIYLGSVGGNGAAMELLNSGQQLPGNTNAGFHTRFDVPVLAFDGTLVAFHATDSNSGSPTNPAGLFGLYTTDLASHTIGKIADANSTLPGLGRLTAIALSGVAVHRGSVLFQATDATGASGLYVWKSSGLIARIIGTGDLLDGRAVQAVADPGPAALFGASCAFVVNFGNDRALYVATEAFASVSAASYASGASLAPGSIASGFGQGLAPFTEQAVALPLPTTLANTAIALQDSAGVQWPAPLFYVSAGQINYLAPDGAAPGYATLIVTSQGRVAATGAVNIAPVAPGLFTANQDGQGAPAGEAIMVAPDQTQTRQPLAQCGATAGSCATRPIDLGPAGTQVFLSLYGTGIRGLTSLAGVTAAIGGLGAPVQYAGAQPQLAGLDQVNLAIPRALAGRGDVDVTLTVDGKAANVVRVNIK